MDDTSSFVEDRLDDGVFRVDRGIYTRPEIFEAEMERVFGRVWVYLCHESQVAAHGDYYATDIGRQPVFVVRREDGGLGAFINACAHRGAVLTPLDLSGLDAIVETCQAENIEAIAVCFLHAYRNPTHERRVRDAIAPRSTYEAVYEGHRQARKL